MELNAEIRAEIKEIVCEAIKEEMESFFVERERHYNEHQFVKSWMDWADKCKSNIFKALISCLIYAALGAMVLGFVFWGKKQ
ncbi:MAG TPA: hypothetical protein DDX29_12045 [Clostridiales bacterium]|nr:hypothetical protein [Clostridiales bacterium]